MSDIYISIKVGNLKSFLNHFIIEDINKKSEYGYGLLHLAISNDKFDIANFLIDEGIDLDMTNADGQTALHHICVYDMCTDQHIEIAKKLLEKGIDINIRDKWGNNAMWTAAFNCDGKDYRMVELLMQYNPDVITKNKVGRSPIDLAIRHDDEKLIDILLEGSKNQS